MATYDGSDEPLFADDLDDFPDDEEPPPLPPPVFPRPRSSSAQDQEGDTSHRVGGGFQVSTHGHSDGWGTSNSTSNQRGPGLRDMGDNQPEDRREEQQPVKKVRKPLLTLKMDRLFSEKGFPYLVKEFPKLKFKGKDSETKDLKLLLQQYEYWANGLFPKLTFRDFCRRVEAMARKSEFRSQMTDLRRRSAGLTGEEEEEGDAAVGERLSPELGDSTLQLSPTNQRREEGVTESENMAPESQPEPTLGPSSSSAPEEFPNPWDVVTEEEDDVDPYKDIEDMQELSP